MIKTIYLDMDGVLCNFEDMAVGKRALDLVSRTLNWELMKSFGSEFWEELPWIREGLRLYTWLYTFCIQNKIDLCILSAVALEDGKIGKLNWIKNNIKINPLCVYFVDSGKDKKHFAEENAILIDDYSKNVSEFISAGGKAILFNNDAKEVVDKIKKIMD